MNLIEVESIAYQSLQVLTSTCVPSQIDSYSSVMIIHLPNGFACFVELLDDTLNILVHLEVCSVHRERRPAEQQTVRPGRNVKKSSVSLFLH